MYLVEKLMMRSKTRKYIHPAYRQLVLRKQRLCRRAKRKISTARKILDRAIHYSPIPCVQPFLCHQCGLSSCELHTLLEHNCGKKIGGLSEYANWQRIVVHGYKSKAKDALAVLETVPFPQKARLQRITAKKHEEAVDGPVAPVFNPKSLVDCAYGVLETTQFCHSPDEVEVEGPHKVIERETLVEDDLYSGPKRVGYYCQKCRRIFRPFYAFTNHLVEGSICANLPDPEQVDITSLFPLNGKITEPTVFEPPKYEMTCTRCKQSDFESREKFHEHLFDCARNPEFDTDEDPVPTDTFSESSST